MRSRKNRIYLYRRCRNWLKYAAACMAIAGAAGASAGMIIKK